MKRDFGVIFCSFLREYRLSRPRLTTSGMYISQKKKYIYIYIYMQCYGAKKKKKVVRDNQLAVIDANWCHARAVPEAR